MRRLRGAGAPLPAAARGVRRPWGLALSTAALLLLSAPARADEPLQLVSVTAADSDISVVADVPAPAAASDPPPAFEVFDGPARLPVEAAPVLDPRRTVTLVVDAGAASTPDGLADLQRVATDLVLRLGTGVQLGVVASRGSEPVLIEPQGVAAAATALSGLRLSAGDEAGLAPAVRAANRRGLTGVGSPHVVVVLAAGAADVPAEDLGRELAAGRGLVYAIAPGGDGADYWREVADLTGGAVEPAGGRAVGSLAGQLARQHVVGFRAPRAEGSVRLLARTPAGTLTADVALASASRDGSTPGEHRSVGHWLIATATLLLVLVAVGHLLALAAVRRRREQAGRAGAAARPAASSGRSVHVGAHRRQQATARARGAAPAGPAVVGAHRRFGAAHGAGRGHGGGSGDGRSRGPDAAAPGVDSPGRGAAGGQLPAVPGGPATRVPAGRTGAQESPAEQAVTATPDPRPARRGGVGTPVLGEAAPGDVTLPVVPPVPPRTSACGSDSANTHVPRHARADDGDAASIPEPHRARPLPVEVPRQRGRAPRMPDGPEPPTPPA